MAFHNEFDKFNNTYARMSDSIYHMTLKLFCYRTFGVKKLINYHILLIVIVDVITYRYNM